MKLRMVMAAGIVLASATASSAHHTVSDFFDTTKLVTLQGTLTRVDWRAPHVILRLETRRADGSTIGWSLETQTPQALERAGLGLDAFKVGGPFSATVCVARDGTRWAVTHEIAKSGGPAAVSVGGC
jgi:hypothetical protein